jgi:tetratricopeptide (TPR) repeat protein
MLALFVATALFTSKPPSRLAQIDAAITARLERQHDVWFEQGEFPKTVQLLRFETELAPADYDTWTNLGWMQENVEQYPAAEATYERYRKLNPKDPDRSLPIAEYWFRKRQWATAIKQIERDLPGKVHPNAFRIVANSYERLKKYPESIRVWTEYIKRSPTDLAAQANLRRVAKKSQSQ